MFNPRQCQRSATRDGWCPVHHPAQVKLRIEQKALRWERKHQQAMAPYNRLSRAHRLLRQVLRALTMIDTPGASPALARLRMAISKELK
jgi:hypothetical protein